MHTSKKKQIPFLFNGRKYSLSLGLKEKQTIFPFLDRESVIFELQKQTVPSSPLNLV